MASQDQISPLALNMMCNIIPVRQDICTSVYWKNSLLAGETQTLAKRDIIPHITLLAVIHLTII